MTWSKSLEQEGGASPSLGNDDVCPGVDHLYHQAPWSLPIPPLPLTPLYC